MAAKKGGKRGEPLITNQEWAQATLTFAGANSLARRIGVPKRILGKVQRRVIELAAIVHAELQRPETPLNFIQQNIKRHVMSADVASKRKISADIREFTDLGIPVMGDNIGQTNLEDSKLIPLSMEQLVKVQAISPEERRLLKIVKVAPEQSFFRLAAINSDSVREFSAKQDRNILIETTEEGYYELLLGSLPYTYGAMYKEAIGMLTEGQYLTSPQATWIADVSDIKAGGPGIIDERGVTRLASVSNTGLVLYRSHGGGNYISEVVGNSLFREATICASIE